LRQRLCELPKYTHEVPTSNGKRAGRQKNDQSTHHHILEVAAEMLREGEKEHFHMAQLAERASVGVPTIYYYFASLNELVAHAQIVNYLYLSRPIHSYDEQIATSFERKDEALFWDAMNGHMEKMWRAGGFDGNFGIIRVLSDIWADEGAKTKLQGMMRNRVEYWTSTARQAQELGWVSPHLDAEVLIKVLWSAGIGHGVLGEDFIIADGEARVASFAERWMRFAGPTDGVVDAKKPGKSARDAKVVRPSRAAPTP
jgi:AcrR family transcriptional regulator